LSASTRTGAEPGFCFDHFRKHIKEEQMRAFAVCFLAFGLLAGTTAMAAGGNNNSSTRANAPAPAEPANSSSAANPNTGGNAGANANVTASPPPAGPSPAEERIASELDSLRSLIEAQSKQIQEQNEELKEQQQKTAALEEQLRALSPANGSAASGAASSLAASTAASAPSVDAASGPAASVALAPAANGGAAQQSSNMELNAQYAGGFHVATADNKFTMTVNGLFQPRFTAFAPNTDAQALGAPAAETNDFDIYLGRLALSGSIFDPSVKYFVQFQGSTSSNTNSMNFIDWFAEKVFSPKFSVQLGRSWTPYSLENLDSPGKYLFPDFSAAEYAFALSRAVGFEAQGQAGKLGYALMIDNSVPALDAGGQENFNKKLAFIGHVHYDVLAPYGYQESDPNGAPSPELTIWSSVAYNPVAASSSFSNETAGDRTVGATTTVGFRDGFFTLQNTGFYRRTLSSFEPNFNAWGYAEQAAYYVIPKHLEIDARISGVLWGAPDFLGVTPGYDVNTWYSGPNFPYHRIVEHSVGLNYYLYGHNAKLQTAYSYLTGDTFSDQGFAASRVWIQAQVMF
jgi:hypothetical protein